MIARRAWVKRSSDMPAKVAQDVFLTELTKMYATNRAKGTVSVSFKKGALSS
jgi:hypothetical protein